MMPSSDACPRIDRKNTGWKKIVPGECLAGVRVLSLQGIRKLDAGNIRIAIMLEDEPGVLDSIFQVFDEFIRKNGCAILVSLAAPDE